MSAAASFAFDHYANMRLCDIIKQANQLLNRHIVYHLPLAMLVSNFKGLIG